MEHTTVKAEILDLINANKQMKGSFSIVIDQYIEKIKELELNLSNSTKVIQSLQQTNIEQKQDIEKYKNNYSIILEKGKELDKTIKELQTKHDTLQHTNEKLISTIQKYQQEINNKDNEIEHLKSTKTSLNTISQQYNERNEQLQKLTVQNAVLLKELEHCKMSIENTDKLKQVHANTIKELERQKHDDTEKLQKDISKVRTDNEKLIKSYIKTIDDMKTSYENSIKTLRIEHENKLSTLKQSHEHEIKTLHTDYASKISTLKKDNEQTQHKLNQKINQLRNLIATDKIV